MPTLEAMGDSTACEYFLKEVQLCGDPEVDEGEKVVRKNPQTAMAKD